MMQLEAQEGSMLRVFAIFATVVVVGCAHSSQPPEPRPQTNVLSRDEIATAPVTNAYEAVDRLRPRFLRPHATGGRPATALATVFIDGVRRGEPEILRSVAVNSVMEIRYLTAADATTRYGLDIPGGVIDVRLLGR
jgi:hypothetical protein